MRIVGSVFQKGGRISRGSVPGVFKNSEGMSKE